MLSIGVIDTFVGVCIESVLYEGGESLGKSGTSKGRTDGSDIE